MNYYERIQQSIDYIERHLRDEALQIRDIAGQAFFSLTHFYRIFQAMTGVTVKEYIRKRRLSEAASELLTTGNRIIDIAFDYGFDSQESFTRACSRQFGATPGDIRRRTRYIPLFEKADLLCSRIDPADDSLLPPRIVLDRTFHVTGIAQTVKPGSPAIAELWSAFHACKGGISIPLQPDVWLGICEYMPELTDEDAFTYLTCMETTEHAPIPAGMISATIPSAKYAVFTHQGSISKLKHTYAHIYGTWLPRSGYELAEQDTIEVYGTHSDAPEPAFDIYLPVL
ncbi:AraC family transcriptional regulator [Paenibacillus sp. NFR01]|uniref:AraC family transcriptional regulator n=1 Tax=Paenibacillus sp. NFR01 TaxID=1566279 RepID=UPI000A61A62A|nr:AraC family transcriptional regulator [Paenibacillus sp. NFR01]